MSYEQKLEQKYVDYLLSQNCTITDDGSILTENGDYVGAAFLSAKQNVGMITVYSHKLTQLQSLSFAKGKGNGAISLGLSEKEQAWYGFTHRGYGSFKIGQRIQFDTAVCNSEEFPIEPGFVCKTLDDCKYCAMAMADVLD